MKLVIAFPPICHGLPAVLSVLTRVFFLTQIGDQPMDDREEKPGREPAHENARHSLERSEHPPALRQYKIAVANGRVGDSGKIAGRPRHRACSPAKNKKAPRAQSRPGGSGAANMPTRLSAKQGPEARLC